MRRGAAAACKHATLGIGRGRLGGARGRSEGVNSETRPARGAGSLMRSQTKVSDYYFIVNVTVSFALPGDVLKVTEYPFPPSGLGGISFPPVPREDEASI